MDEKEKKNLILKELNKLENIGDQQAGGSGHVSVSEIHRLKTGPEKDGSFSFSVEIVRLSEFGDRTYWYYGTISMRDSGKSEIKIHKYSGMNTAMYFVSDEAKKKVENKIGKVRKQLNLV